MSVLAFLSEPFSLENNVYLSSKPSINFIRSCFNEKCVVVGYESKSSVSNPSSKVLENDFEWIYGYKSIIDFIFKVVKNPIFLVKYINRCDSLLEKYNDYDIWVRNPSIGCLIFTLRAIKFHNGKIYNHMCANAGNAWNSSKYSWYMKPFAFSFSLVLKYLIYKVVSNSKVTNLCTGIELESYCKLYNKNTFQLIDSNIEATYQPKGYSNDKFVFTYIGRIQKDKGVVELIDSFVDLSSSSSKDMYLNVVGDGVLLSQLKMKYKNRTNIVFFGSIPNDEIGNVLEKSHAVVVPSNNGYEGFPRVILEAWAFGLPVIVSDVGGVRGLVKHGVNGFVFSYKNKNLLYYLNKITDKCEYEIISRGVIDFQNFTIKDYWVRIFKSI